MYIIHRTPTGAHIHTHTHTVSVQLRLGFLCLKGLPFATSRSALHMTPSSVSLLANQFFPTFALLPFGRADTLPLPSKSLFSRLEHQVPLLCFSFPYLR